MENVRPSEIKDGEILFVNHGGQKPIVVVISLPDQEVRTFMSNQIVLTPTPRGFTSRPATRAERRIPKKGEHIRVIYTPISGKLKKWAYPAQ